MPAGGIAKVTTSGNLEYYFNIRDYVNREPCGCNTFYISTEDPEDHTPAKKNTHEKYQSKTKPPITGLRNIYGKNKRRR